MRSLPASSDGRLARGGLGPVPAGRRPGARVPAERWRHPTTLPTYAHCHVPANPWQCPGSRLPGQPIRAAPQWGRSQAPMALVARRHRRVPACVVLCGRGFPGHRTGQRHDRGARAVRFVHGATRKSRPRFHWHRWCLPDRGSPRGRNRRDDLRRRCGLRGTCPIRGGCGLLHAPARQRRAPFVLGAARIPAGLLHDFADAAAAAGSENPAAGGRPAATARRQTAALDGVRLPQRPTTGLQGASVGSDGRGWRRAHVAVTIPGSMSRAPKSEPPGI